jgi:hypothetical protein
MYVCSGVRTRLFAAPSAFTSLKSLAYSGLVSDLGPAVRNCDELCMRKGFTPPTQGVGSRMGCPVAGLMRGCQCPGAEFGTHCDGPNRPSSFLAAIIASAAASPAVIPWALNGESGIGASEEA